MAAQNRDPVNLRSWRIVLGAAGILLALFGAFRLLTQVPIADGAILAAWMVGVVVIHDGVLSPLVIAVGTLVARTPPRARRYVQFALVTGATIAVIGVVLVARRGSQPAAKALLLRDYGTNLAILLGLVAAGSLGAYAARVAREARSRPHGGRGDGGDLSNGAHCD
jgi:hypothetical protein